MANAAKKSYATWTAAGVVVLVAYSWIVGAIWRGHRDGFARAAALATVVQAPLVVGTIAVAAVQVVAAARASREQAEAGERLERASARPYVTVGLDYLSVWGSVYLEIANLGRTAARNVTVTVEPALETSLEKPGERWNPSDTPFLNHPVPVLVPSQRLPSLIEVGAHRAEAIEGGAVFVDQFMFSVTYYDDEGVRYDSEFPIDLMMLWSLVAPNPDGVPELVKHVKALNATVKALRPSPPIFKSP